MAEKTNEPTDYSALRKFQLYDAQSSLNLQQLSLIDDQQKCGIPSVQRVWSTVYNLQ